MSDEDRLIERLEIHKKLIGWLITELRKQGIEAQRTTGNNPKGDIFILNKENVLQVKEILRNLYSKFKDVNNYKKIATIDDPHIEVKAWTTKKIDSTKAKEIRDKATVIGVVTTGGITKPAKTVFDEADIAWVENFPESELILNKEQEEGSC